MATGGNETTVQSAGETASVRAAKGSTSPALSLSQLLATVFVTGAAVITIEILGTRIIGPVFGVSLFIWSALLAVTLSSLAIGYYGGGVLADRRPIAQVLHIVVAASGVFLGLVPALSHGVLGACESLGPRAGPLVSAFVLFSPSLIVLGMVGPIVVRLATTDIRATGRGVGAVYAVSTAGSLAGTLLTAFVIIPAFETNQILFGTAIVLVATGAIQLARLGKFAPLLGLLVPALSQAAAPKHALPPGITIVDRSQSYYGLVQVIEDKKRGVRFLRSDHSVIGAQWMGDGAPAFSFIHVLEAIQYAKPGAKNLLEIGLGTGALPTLLKNTGIKVDVIEIDPAVVDFATKYFGFSTSGDIFAEDARTFIQRTERRYDLIVHDTFTGGTTPEHLLSLEVAERIRAILNPDGVLALNFVGYQDGPKSEASRAVARTLRKVFPVVRVFRDSPPDKNADEASNLIFFASNGPLSFAIPPQATEKVLRAFEEWEVLQQVPDGDIITDSRNPLAQLQLPIAEEHFEGMNKLLPLEVWLQ
jgi:predicted membrane-bound spermidine synthase